MKIIYIIVIAWFFSSLFMYFEFNETNLEAAPARNYVECLMKFHDQLAD